MDEELDKCAPYILLGAVDADISAQLPPVFKIDEPTEKKRVLSPEHGQIIRDSYATIKDQAPNHALVMYLTIFDVEPEAKQLFSALHKSPIPVPVNPGLAGHGMKAWTMMCEAFCKMDDAAEVEAMTPYFSALGGRHLKYGINADDFPVFRTGFMKSLYKAFDDKWFGDLEEAWCAAFDVLEVISTDGMAVLGGKKELPKWLVESRKRDEEARGTAA